MGCIVCWVGKQGNAQSHSPECPAPRERPLGPQLVRSMDPRGTGDLSVSQGGPWQSLHFCGMRWKSETIKKGEGRDRKEKERKSKETIKCYHLAGASPGDETANEPKVLRAQRLIQTRQITAPDTPVQVLRMCPRSKPGMSVLPPTKLPIHPAAQLGLVRVEERRGGKGQLDGENTPTRSRSYPVVSTPGNILEHHPRPAYL